MDLIERVEKLERSNRRLRATLLVCAVVGAAVGLMGADDKPKEKDDEVTLLKQASCDHLFCKHLVIGETGKGRIVIDASDDGEKASLTSYDSKGNVRVSIGEFGKYAIAVSSPGEKRVGFVGVDGVHTVIDKK